MSKHGMFASCLAMIAYLLLPAHNAYAYLDPGTGTAMAQFIVAALAAGIFSLGSFWRSIKNIFRPQMRKPSIPEVQSDLVKE